MVVDEGSRLQLSCSFRGGTPPIYLYWAKEGGHPILVARSDCDRSVIHGKDEENELKSYSVTKSSPIVTLAYTVNPVIRHHSGRYVCAAVNVAGGSMTHVGVRVRPPHLLPPPIIRIGPRNTTVVKGGRLALLCRVWGADTVLWQHKQKVLTSDVRHTILQDHTLTITGNENKVC